MTASAARVRHDGWTPERKRAFLETLGERGSVRAAATAVGMSATSAYKLRGRPGEVAFANAWDQALAYCAQSLQDTLFERAVDGWDEPIFRDGKQVGVRRRYDNQMIKWLLLTNDRRVPRRDAERFTTGFDPSKRGVDFARALDDLSPHETKTAPVTTS